MTLTKDLRLIRLWSIPTLSDGKFFISRLISNEKHAYVIGSSSKVTNKGAKISTNPCMYPICRFSQTNVVITFRSFVKFSDFTKYS